MANTQAEGGEETPVIRHVLHLSESGELDDRTLLDQITHCTSEALLSEYLAPTACEPSATRCNG